MDTVVANYETQPVPTFIPSDALWVNVGSYCAVATEVNSTSAVMLPLDQADDTKQYKCHIVKSGDKLNIAAALYSAILSTPQVKTSLLAKVVSDWAIANSTDNVTRTLPVISVKDIAAQFRPAMEMQNVFFGNEFQSRKYSHSYLTSLPKLPVHSLSVHIDDDVVVFCKQNGIESSLNTFIKLAREVFPMASKIDCQLAHDPEIDKLTTVKLNIHIKTDVDILLKLDSAFTKSMIAHLPNRDVHFFVKTYEVIE